MTGELIKQRVLELRHRGVSYGQIADEVDLSRNTVKSMCRRAGITAQTDGDLDPRTCCELCQQPLPQLITGRRFCSDRCRMAWWHAHPERLNRQAIYTFTCAACGESFDAYGNKHRKYCSHPCYIRHRFNTRGGRP